MVNHTATRTEDRHVRYSTLAGAACILSYVLTAVCYLAPVEHIPREVPQDGPNYRQIFEQFLEADTQVAPLAEKATSLLVVTDPSWCKPCQKLELVIADLRKEGYDITTETPAQYRKRPGAQRVSSLPTLFFVTKDKVTNVAIGYQNKQYIQKYLGKPLPGQSN